MILQQNDYDLEKVIAGQSPTYEPFLYRSKLFSPVFSQVFVGLKINKNRIAMIHFRSCQDWKIEIHSRHPEDKREQVDGHLGLRAFS